MAPIFIRTLIIYLLLIFTMRLSGKRQIGEMQVSELVSTFLLSELASLPLTNPGIPLLLSVVPIITIISLEIILSFCATKCPTIKKIFAGKPSILIRHGKLQKGELVKMRLTLDDLLRELRLKDIASLSDVDYAILEANGKISVFDTKTSLSHAFVIDGILQTNALEEAGRSETWIRSLLKEQSITSFEEVFLLSATDVGDITLIKKGDTE